MGDSLESVIARIPGYAGYKAAEQNTQQRELGDLQKAHTLQSLIAQIQMQDLNKQFSGAMSGGGGTPEQLDALAAKLAAGGHPGAAALSGLADKRRKSIADAATLKTIQTPAPSPVQSAPDPEGLKMVANTGDTTIPGTNWTNPSAAQVPPEERAAFDKVLNTARTTNAAARGEGGLFATLMQSEVPAVANQAKLFQQQANVSDPRSVSPTHWLDLQKQLAAQESSLLERRSNTANKNEPLVAILGDDGKPILVPRSQAAGRRPASSAESAIHGDFSKSGEEFLNSLPENDRQLVKKIANYDIDPKTLSTKGGQREKMLSLVSHYDPTYDDTQYANKRRAITQFGTGPQGNTVRSLNVAVEHIDTLNRAADALKNGDFTPGNKVYNEIAKVFGKTPPNTFEGIRDLVANEVVKGTIGNSGALADREEAAAKVKASSSPDQLKDLMNSWTELMGGQVKGLERQYEASTKNKDFRERYLTQRTRDAIALSESKATSSASPAAAPTATSQKVGEKSKSKSGKPITWDGKQWTYD